MSGILLLILRLVIVIILYSFLCWALYVLWRDLRRQSAGVDEKIIPQLGLYPQDTTAGSPRTFSVTEITVGRDPNSDLALDDRTISSHHAHLVFRQDQWWVEDLGSTNGTFLNDHRIDTPTVITHGDHLQFGQYEFLVTIDLLQSTGKPLATMRQ
jgi:pSer/pThr/pTyr-binding forkhead associated (FHA) protein